MSAGSSIYGQTAHKPGCPTLLYGINSGCTCGDVKGPVATQLERIEESQGKLYSMQLALAERVDRMVAGLTAGQNALKGQLQGGMDAIATTFGMQRKTLEDMKIHLGNIELDTIVLTNPAKPKKRSKVHGKRRK